jgi:hypothetical protein
LKVLVDEALPVAIAAELSGYDVATLRAQRWLA